jgi:TIR domain
MPKPTQQRLPLIFISHDHNDRALASEFCELLKRSHGSLRTFNASDEKSWESQRTGEWYPHLREKLLEATSLVALVTRRSLQRPWIFYEAGFASCRNALVSVVTLGITTEEMGRNPLTQFKHWPGDETSLTQLVLKLISHCDSIATPSQQAVQHWVQTFLRELARSEVVEVAASRVEEMRLAGESALLAGELRDDWHHKILGPRLAAEFPLLLEDGNYDGTGLLLLLGIYREDLPAMYDLGLELHRAISAQDALASRRAREQLLRSVRTMAENVWLRTNLAEINRALAFALPNLAEFLESYLRQLDPKT